MIQLPRQQHQKKPFWVNGRLQYLEAIPPLKKMTKILVVWGLAVVSSSQPAAIFFLRPSAKDQGIT